MTLREDLALDILEHFCGYGARELSEAEDGEDHQEDWEAALKTADIILDRLRTREDAEETIRRVVEKALAASRDSDAAR